MKCLFCSIAKQPSNHTKPEDEILEETRCFYVKPALGHFVDGYTLIISKRHRRSLSYCSTSELSELEHLKQRVSNHLSSMYQQSLVIFEHGEVCPGLRAGCCIDHAHLHLIPCDVDPGHILEQQFRFELVDEFVSLRKCRQEYKSYIYYEKALSPRRVFRVETGVPSQYLRRLICENLGHPEEWDWAVFPFRERIEKFKKEYKSFGSLLRS